jgi:arylsulfatase
VTEPEPPGKHSGGDERFAIKFSTDNPSVHDRYTLLRLLALSSLLWLVGCGGPGEKGKSPGERARPNFLIILTDDMGYTDLGAFGGRDIDTPNLDRLALEGIRFTNFHGHVSCAPSRATLLSGTRNHDAGLGTQVDIGTFRGKKGYERYLVERVATLPEVLRAGGYRTYISGKWGLGGPAGIDPVQRGFDRSFVLVPSGGGHYQAIMHDSRYSRDGRPVPESGKSEFSTTLFVDELISFFDDDRLSDAPFFALFTPTAPHWPLHFPPGMAGSHAGAYERGYEALREQRVAGAARAGVLPHDADVDGFVARAEAWNSLSDEDRKMQSLIMEIYAAMTAHLDMEVGRLLRSLDDAGKLENTLIFFVNDNGAQGGPVFGGPRSYSEGRRFDNRAENLGQADSWVNMGQGWAEAVSAPFRGSKASVYEGGIRVAAFANWQGIANPGTVYSHYLNNMDVMPTMLELAGIPIPGPTFGDREIAPLRGRSFAAILEGTNTAVHASDETIVLSSAGRHFVQRGRWKLAKELQSDWELYDLSADPYERINLASDRADILQEMLAEFHAAALESNILDR